MSQMICPKATVDGLCSLGRYETMGCRCPSAVPHDEAMDCQRWGTCPACVPVDRIKCELCGAFSAVPVCADCVAKAVALYRRIKAGESVGPLVDMLPKTADGKPAAPGMDVWELRASGEIRKCWVYEIGSESAEARCGWGSPDPAWYRCYSTEEAAIQARNALSEKGGGE